MSSSPITSSAELDPEACPGCGHLRGDRLDRCSECGLGTADAHVMRRRGTPRRRWTRASVAVLVATYLPQAWVVLLPGSWSGHRISWIKMYPILPGLLPAAFGRNSLRFDDQGLFATAGACTVLILAVAWWAASRGPRWLIVTSVLLLVVNIPLAFALHAAYSA